MRLRHIGYACQNMTLGTKSRTVRLANLRTEAVIPVIAQNLDDVLAALRWNVAHGLPFFRISSDLIPFGSKPEFPFRWQDAFAWKFDEIRRFVKTHDVRVTSHPGQYTVLNSPRPEVVEAAIEELDFQADVLGRMAPAGTMTLHVGGAYGDRAAALERFEQGLDRLSPDARARLTIENDDTTWSLPEVLTLAEKTGLPVVADLFHHRVFPSDTPWGEGVVELLGRAAATWGKRVPKLHLSSGKPGARTSHADFLDMDDVQTLIDLMEQVPGDAPYDLMLEAKRKEQAALEVKAFVETGARPARRIPMADSDLETSPCDPVEVSAAA